MIVAECFHQLLLAQLPRLRAYARSITHNHADADDLVQSTAVLALQYKSQFEIGTNFSAWVFRILKNRFIDDRRHYYRRRVTLVECPHDQLADFWVTTSARQEESVFVTEIVQAMEKLTPDLSQVLILLCSAELSYEEAATEMACSASAVKSRLWRARNRMKRFLE